MVPVARAEPRRHLAGNGPAQGVAEAGPPQLWRATGAGTGYSSFSASSGRLYTLGARGDNEFVIAFDARPARSSGKRRTAPLRNDQGDGPRSTPTVDGDRLYAFGGSGDLTCLDAATGKKIWSVNVVQKFGGVNPYWGYSESPLDRRRPHHLQRRRPPRVDRRDRQGGRQDAVAEPQRRGRLFVADAAADRQPRAGGVLHRPRALAVDPRDGRLLWSYNKAEQGTANIATPIVRGTRVFFSSDYGTGAALLDVQAAGNIASASEVYFTREMRNHHASSVLVGEHIYGFSSSILTALKFDTGQMAWRDRSVGKGSLIYADSRLYLYSEDGVVGLADASPGRLPRARPLHDSSRPACRPGAIRSSRTGA